MNLQKKVISINIYLVSCTFTIGSASESQNKD